MEITGSGAGPEADWIPCWGGWLGEGSSNPGSRFPGVGYWPGWRLSSGAEA